MAEFDLHWQSRLILLLVMPYVSVRVVMEAHTWAANAPQADFWVLVVSALLGLVAWRAHAATPAAAVAGAVLNAGMMYSTLVYPYHPWQTATVAVLTLLLLTSLGTRFRRDRKERLGVAEKRHGRGAAQVAANLGCAALAFDPAITSEMAAHIGIQPEHTSSLLLFSIGLAALAEAAADTISSELGQALGGRPRMLTTLRIVPPGTDGAITLAGTLAGILAAGMVAAAGTLAWHGGTAMLAISWAGGVFGLFFDSLLGATIEGPKWLNNDAVNFLSTISAVLFACALIRWFAR